MKKHYEDPQFDIDFFVIESILTDGVSGTRTGLADSEEEIEVEGDEW